MGQFLCSTRGGGRGIKILQEICHRETLFHLRNSEVQNQFHRRDILCTKRCQILTLKEWIFPIRSRFSTVFSHQGFIVEIVSLLNWYRCIAIYCIQEFNDHRFQFVVLEIDLIFLLLARIVFFIFIFYICLIIIVNFLNIHVVSSTSHCAFHFTI